MINNIIKSNNISIYSLAKTIQCDRTGLQKVISGERKINFTNFNAMYRELQKEIDSKLLNNLYEKFMEDYYGEKKYNRMLYIKYRLYKTKKLQDYIENLGNVFNIDEYVKKFDIRDKEEILAKKIFKMIKEEIEYANCTGNIPKLYTNIPADWENIKNLLLIIINVFKLKGNIDFKYIMNSKCNDDVITMQIENFITSSEFAAYGINTSVTGESANNINADNVIFPYYVITGREVVMISDDGNLYIEYDNEDMVKLICEEVKYKISNMEEFLTAINPDTYLSELLSGSMDKVNRVFSMGNRISIAILYTKDILKKIVPNYYPKREFIIEAFDMVYGRLREGKLVTYFTIESIRHFIMSNESKYEGQYFNLQFTHKIKMELLKKLYRYYADSEAEIYMIKSGEYLANDNMRIFGWDNIIVGAIGHLYYGDRLTDAMNFTYSPVISEYMYMYNEYIKNSNICLDKSNSLKVLKMLITSYENKYSTAPLGICKEINYSVIFK